MEDVLTWLFKMRLLHVARVGWWRGGVCRSRLGDKLPTWGRTPPRLQDLSPEPDNISGPFFEPHHKVLLERHLRSLSTVVH